MSEVADIEMMEAMSRYTAHATRDGRFWLIHVPEIDRHTQARHLREVDTMARDLIAVMNDVDPAGIDLEVRIERAAEGSES